jgi:enoyl-[acyl-carrier protein] reductase I
MLNIDLTGRRALVAGVADDGGFGFAIAKALAEAGATVCVGTWPPALNIFLNLLERGKMDASLALRSGAEAAVRAHLPARRRLRHPRRRSRGAAREQAVQGHGDFSIDGLAARPHADFGAQPLDIVVTRSPTARGEKPLLETSRAGYLTAVGVSAYSLVSLVQRLGPAHAPGRLLLVAHLHGERARGAGLRRRDVVGRRRRSRATPGARVRGGAQVRRAREHDLGRPVREPRGERDRDHRPDGRVLRAEHAPPEALQAEEVGTVAAFLASPLATGITGTTVYVDKGYHAMGMTAPPAA